MEVMTADEVICVLDSVLKKLAAGTDKIEEPKILIRALFSANKLICERIGTNLPEEYKKVLILLEEDLERYMNYECHH